MSIVAAYSEEPEVTRVVAELKQKLAGLEPRFIIFFASPHYDPPSLGAELNKAFPDVRAIGSTTAGELGQGKMLTRSVSVLAFDADDVGMVETACIAPLKEAGSLAQGLTQLEAKVGAQLASLDPSTHLGLVLHDGLSVAEERVMAELSSATNVPFIGGSAGDGGAFKTTWVFDGFRPVTNASVLAVLELPRPYKILKTQSFDLREGILEVTEADEATRTVKRFNGQPAASEYARVLGVDKAKLSDQFMTHPLGLVVGDGEPYVRSPQQVQGDDVVFYCTIKEGMRLNVLNSRNIVDDTRRDLQEALSQFGGCRAILNFHCILRTLELQQRDQCEAYGRLFADYPTAGLSTYGESYIGHINQTSTLVLFA